MAAGRVSGFEGEFIHSQLCEFHSVSFIYMLVSIAEGVHVSCRGSLFEFGFSYLSFKGS